MLRADPVKFSLISLKFTCILDFLVRKEGNKFAAISATFARSTYAMVYYSRYFYSIKMASMENCRRFDSIEYEQDFYLDFI